MVALLFYNYY